jgi:hypothetical protein
MAMDWRHYVGMVLLVVLGYWLHSKYPGLLSKATAGTVSA